MVSVTRLSRALSLVPFYYRVHLFVRVVEVKLSYVLQYLSCQIGIND